MKLQWYVEKWYGNTYIERTPYAMTKNEADRLADALKVVGNAQFTFKVVHRKELTKVA